MANYADSTYRIYGDVASVDALQKLMTQLEAEKENGNWVGHIVNALGGNEHLYVRGWWDSLEREDENTLTFHLESAWEPLNEAWDWICGKFEELTAYFIGEEPGCEVYLKRSLPERGWFSENYYLDACLPDSEEYIHEYFDDIDSAFRFIEKLTDTNIITADDIEALNLAWGVDHEDAYIYLHEYQEV